MCVIFCSTFREKGNPYLLGSTLGSPLGLGFGKQKTGRKYMEIGIAVYNNLYLIFEGGKFGLTENKCELLVC